VAQTHEKSNYPDNWITLKCCMGLDICAIDDQITIRHNFVDGNVKPAQLSSWHKRSEVEKIVNFLNIFLEGTI
jgi:hypothetical protein